MLKKTLIALTLPLLSVLAISVGHPTVGAFSATRIKRRSAPWLQPHSARSKR